MRSICVFCGSSDGARPEYREQARELANEMAVRGLRLVYGGANRGTMATLADSMLAAGGQVTGVIPQALVEMEIAHRGLTELQTVGSLQERKAAMADLSDGFIALPGGLGTLDEFFEMLTWTQLGLQAKPCGLLSVEGYFDRLLEFLDGSVAEGFVSPTHRDMVLVETDVAILLDRLAAS